MTTLTATLPAVSRRYTQPRESESVRPRGLECIPRPHSAIETGLGTISVAGVDPVFEVILQQGRTLPLINGSRLTHNATLLTPRAGVHGLAVRFPSHPMFHIPTTNRGIPESGTTDV
jgi:hypothetical protein